MKTEVSSAARKIARKHNANMGMGGKLVFGRDGSGGAWYSDTSYGFGEDTLVVHVGHDKMTGAKAQEILDRE